MRTRGYSISRRRKTCLPEELIFQILAKLPPKSVGRFTLVSQTWHTLISHPTFPHTHLSNLQNNPPYRIIVEINKPSRRPGFSDSQHFSISIADAAEAEEIEFHLVNLRPRTKIYMEATCNGLLVLTASYFDEEETLHVYNPLTRRSRQLCFPPAECMQRSLVHDVNAKRYKLVAFVESVNKLYVLTLGGGEEGPAHIDSEWRELISPYPGVPIEMPVVFANNELHWIMESGQSKQYIQTMTVDKEEFQRIDCPPSVGQYSCLLEMKGSLCVADIVSDDHLDLWGLDDRVKSAWSKSSTINLTSIENRPISVGFRIFNGCTIVGDEVFMLFNNQVMSFNLKTLKWAIAFQVDRLKRILAACTHFYSLASWE